MSHPGWFRVAKTDADGLLLIERGHFLPFDAVGGDLEGAEAAGGRGGLGESEWRLLQREALVGRGGGAVAHHFADRTTGGGETDIGVHRGQVAVVDQVRAGIFEVDLRVRVGRGGACTEETSANSWNVGIGLCWGGER